MRIVSTTGASSLGHDGATYKSDGDGVFDVPEQVGESLVRFPNWLREHEAVDLQRAKDAAVQVSPSALAARVRELEARLAQSEPGESEAELLARVTELEAKLAAAESESTAKAAAKKAAAKKTAATPDGA